MRKKAFTLIEMIFVIIVMGIVAGGTFVQISTIYEQMLQKQGSSELENETKLIVEQITARLSSAIKESIVSTTDLAGTDCKPISDESATGDRVLVWVSRSDESNTGLWDDTIKDYRGWSGFVDVSKTPADNSYIYTRGSKLSYAETVIDDLTGLTGSLSQTPDSPVAIYFKEDGVQQSLSESCKEFGLDTSHRPTKLFGVHRNSTESELRFTDATNYPTTISDQYALTHSAYAIKRDSDRNLKLYSFRPWRGQTPSSDTAPKLLGKNVSGFGFRSEGGIFRINVCLEKNSTDGYPVRVCKEKAIF